MTPPDTDALHGEIRRYSPSTGWRPRLEYDPLHIDVYSDGAVTSEALLDFDALRSLDLNGISAESFLGPEVAVSSTTVATHDRELYDLGIRYEARVVERVRPRQHTPFDVPIYSGGDMEREVRLQNLENYLKGVRWFTDRFENSPTEIVPALKGATVKEWRHCYEGFRGLPGICEINDGTIVVYVGQYFGSEGGGMNEAKKDLWWIDALCEPPAMHVVGLGSPNPLRDLPGSVASVSGLQYWIKRSDFRNVPVPVAQARLRELRSEVSVGLSGGSHQLTIPRSAKDNIR